ncbi:MAG: DUF421 domain-containing protein [Clostridia bacterium]|nr:DUF421 domain-containing protein [Clostridia bacterium]
MINILIRAVLFYFILTIFMRFMGKRQIGEMQMTEFVTMVMLSEMAVLPVTDGEIPLLHGLVPLAVISCAEVAVSFFTSRSKKLLSLISGDPLCLLSGGKYDEKNLKRARISKEDVEAQIRINGYTGPEQVDYVILERTGKMSVIPKQGAQSGNNPGD